LARNLERMGEPGRRQALDVMPYLAGNPDERIRALALDALRAWGEARHIAHVLTLLDEPRNGTVEPVGKLLASLDLDRTEEVARFVLGLSTPSPAQLAWALDQVGVVLEADEQQSFLVDLFPRADAQPAAVRAALARLASRWADPRAEGWLRGFLEDSDSEVQLAALRGLNQQRETRLDGEVLRRLVQAEDPCVRAEVVRAVVVAGDRSLIERLADDPDARVRCRLVELLVPGGGDWLARLQADPHPHVRAAALTPALAAELVRDPGRETSWHVKALAARLAKVPLWKLEPAPPWQPKDSLPAALERLRLNRGTPPHVRVLGPGGPAVSPVGISGHYGLPVEGFVRAVEAGVNLLFWEPNYQTLTEFAGRLTDADRNALHFVTGTFEADGKRVRRDAERALRLLRIDRIALFLLFWVRSWDRVSRDVREALEQLRATGKVAAFGLSTHSRPLAVEAMEAGWDPVMVRHSAAHRGAETEVLPRAVELGTSVLTFNNTCYGRLLSARGDIPPPGAADCYRYTLAQPGVTACWSAPATLDQLTENLAALQDLELPPDRREGLRRQGDLVYEEDAVFRKLVRSR
jgi:hypothetical protein